MRSLEYAGGFLNWTTKAACDGGASRVAADAPGKAGEERWPPVP